MINLGKAISGPPTSNGNKKFPNPPIRAGITIKKIITIACAVIILLYNWLSAIYCTPGPDNSNLISTENDVPANPANKAKIKYKVPMSLALLDRNHLSFHSVIAVSQERSFSNTSSAEKGCFGSISSLE